MKNLRSVAAASVLVFLLLVILWRGGKSLDAVWLVAFLSSGIFILYRPLPRAVPWGFAAALLGLSAWTILSFIFSSVSNYGFDEVLQTVSLMLLCFWAAAQSRTSPRFSGYFAQTVSVATILACVIGIFVYVLQPVSRFVGTFFDQRFHTDYWPNAWAEFLLFAWPLLVWVLWTRDDRTLPKILRGDLPKAAVTGVMLGCLLLSYSRGGLLSLAAQVAVLTVLSLWFGRRPAWKRASVSCVTVAVVGVVVFAAVNGARSNLYPIESALQKVTFTSDEGKSSVSERTQFWMQSLELIREKPLLGHGPYAFRFVQPHLQRDVLATSDHAHNIFLKIATERGVPAAVLLAIIIGWAFVAGMRKVRADKTKGTLPLEIFLLTAITGVVLHNLIDYNLQFVGIALPFFMAIGILSSSEPRSSGRFSNLLSIIALLLFLTTLFEGTNLFLSSRARRSEARGDLIAALGWYALADNAVFPRDNRLAEGAILLGLQQLPQAENAVTRYLADNEADGRAWRLLGDIYLRWNKRTDALRAYEKAYAYGRYNDIGIVRGLVYLLKDQDPEELALRKHDFDELLNEFGLAIQRNTHFIALGKNVEELVSLTELLASEFPADAPAYQALARLSLENANEERARTASRPRGLLW